MEMYCVGESLSDVYMNMIEEEGNSWMLLWKLRVSNWVESKNKLRGKEEVCGNSLFFVGVGMNNGRGLDINEGMKK